MIALNLPEFSFKFRKEGQSKQIFDGIRRKYVVLTPEEWVRQNFIQYLIFDKKYPASLMAVEKGLKVNTLQKRTDIVVYNNQGKPWMLIECKSPEVKIDQETFYQASRYNIKHQAEYLVLTNGLSHFCLRLKQDQAIFESDLPVYEK